MTSSPLQVLKVLVASPGDTATERDILKEVVADINRLDGHPSGYHLDLLLWEDDSYPSVGVDAQDVLNRQLDNYDIFVGILKTRFGTPTRRAQSGTEEEFERAFARHTSDPKSVDILFYFSNPNVRLWSIDFDQLLEIYRFRERLEALGVLYAVYGSADDFRRRSYAHMRRVVQGRLSGQPATQMPVPRPSPGLTRINLSDWHSQQTSFYPQWATYCEVPLNLPRGTPYRLSGIFRSPSPYFRFGIKFLTFKGKVFGDGGIQSQDRNLVIHLGKNSETDLLFVTKYINGLRQDLDIPVQSYGGQEISIALSVAADGTIHFLVDDVDCAQALVDQEITGRLLLIAWGDEHEYEIHFTGASIIAN